MDDFTEKDMQDALKTIASMIERSEKAQGKFAPGTSQHTLQKNRIKALCIVASLIKNELAEPVPERYTKKDMEDALAPLASLISKSEKAQKKLAGGTWQRAMLQNNLRALYIASPLLANALST